MTGSRDPVPLDHDCPRPKDTFNTIFGHVLSKGMDRAAIVQAARATTRHEGK